MSSSVHAFTSVTSNYIPKARVLAESVKRVDPSVCFHLLLSDEPPAGFDLAGEPFDELVLITDLPIENFRPWVFSHRLVELCTAVKGTALEWLFEAKGADKVFYFDPDIAVFDRLDELIGELDEHSVLLTPHQTDPEVSLKGIVDNEICSLRHGVFNLGFVGVANTGEGRRFARWWRDRLLHFCHDDHQRSLFTDQKWVNLAPCMFDEVKVLRSPAFNVSTWNLSTRKATGSLDDGIKINGENLGFYHFSGFDSGAQERQLQEYGDHSPVLFDLRKWYISECERHGQDSLGAVPSVYNFFESGGAIIDSQRILYRNRIDIQQTFPDPYATTGFATPTLAGGYQAWYEANKESNTADEVISVAPNTTIKNFLLGAGSYLDNRGRGAEHIGWLKKMGLTLLASCLRGASRLAS
jgi:hypothetical protein